MKQNEADQILSNYMMDNNEIRPASLVTNLAVSSRKFEDKCDELTLKLDVILKEYGRVKTLLEKLDKVYDDKSDSTLLNSPLSLISHTKETIATCLGMSLSREECQKFRAQVSSLTIYKLLALTGGIQ